MGIDFHYVRTKDDLMLQGVHYDSGSRDLGVLFVHGMSGNLIENYFAHVLGETLSKNKVGFLYAYNRGYNHVNDIATSQMRKKGGYKTVRIGVKYERFKDCLIDIDAWFEDFKKIGYERIILMGHSLGCNKVIYYFSERKPKGVVGVIFASPPDMIGLIKNEKYVPNWRNLYKMAIDNVRADKPREVLPFLIWDWYHLSSQTFLDLCEEDGPVNNLPVFKNPREFKQLASIDVPILGLMGEYDDIAIRTLEKDLNLIASKATNAPSFTKKFIPRASHTYDGQEKVFSGVVLKWVQDKFKQ